MCACVCRNVCVSAKDNKRFKKMFGTHFLYTSKGCAMNVFLFYVEALDSAVQNFTAATRAFQNKLDNDEFLIDR